MTQTWEEWKKENNISLGFSEEMLKRLPLCRGKPVILTGTFNVKSRERNQLIFKSVMPYTKILPHKRRKNVQKKICADISFPVDALWKLRILQSANKSERYYILGYIKLVYEKGKPVGKLMLADDIVPCPIMTESRFMDCNFRFRKMCYRWPGLDEILEEVPAVVQKHRYSPLLLRSLSGEKVYYIQALKRNSRKRRITEIWEKQKNRTLKDCGEESVADEEKTDLETESGLGLKNAAPPDSAEEATPITPDLAQQCRQRNDLLLQYDNKYANGRKLDESVKTVTETHFDMAEQWETEFATKEKVIKFYGCRCELADDIVFISNELELWQIRYSPLYQRIILYHKNKKTIQRYWKKEVVTGYHEQFVPSIKEKPTIKEYVIYASLHMLKVEKSCEKQKRKRR